MPMSPVLYTYLMEVKTSNHGDDWCHNFQVTATSPREAVRIFKERNADNFGEHGEWEIREVSVLLQKSEWE